MPCAELVKTSHLYSRSLVLTLARMVQFHQQFYAQLCQKVGSLINSNIFLAIIRNVIAIDSVWSKMVIEIRPMVQFHQHFYAELGQKVGSCSYIFVLIVCFTSDHHAFVQSIQGQTFHGCINHDKVVGLCYELQMTLSYHSHLGFGK